MDGVRWGWHPLCQKTGRVTSEPLSDKRQGKVHRSAVFQASILFCNWWNSAKSRTEIAVWHRQKEVTAREPHRIVCGLCIWVTWKASQKAISNAHASPTDSTFSVSTSRRNAQLYWHTQDLNNYFTEDQMPKPDGISESRASSLP